MHLADEDMDEERGRQARGKGQDSWIEVTIDMPGFGRDDDGVVVFLAQMLQDPIYFDIARNAIEQQAFEYESEEARRLLEPLDIEDELRGE